MNSGKVGHFLEKTMKNIKKKILLIIFLLILINLSLSVNFNVLLKEKKNTF